MTDFFEVLGAAQLGPVLEAWVSNSLTGFECREPLLIGTKYVIYVLFLR
jgi:hypothetical protein